MDAYQHAINLLLRVSAPAGFMAAIQEHDNYRRIWTRDGVVNGLASLLSGDDRLVTTFASTIQTIFDHQHATGFFPSNIDEKGNASYGGTAGRVDNVAWAIIGLCQYSLFTNNHDLKLKYRSAVERGFNVMDAWEFNGKHLMYVPQSGDWADEYLYHGYILFDQLLRVWALRLAAKVFEREQWSAKAEMICEVIRNNFWRSEELKYPYASNLKHQMRYAPAKYWFMGFNPGRIYHQFDLQANSLALLLGLGTSEQNQTLITFMQQLHDEYRSILPSFYPTIMDDDWQMNELKNNYAYTFRNKPHEFHNGGLWPVWNGLLCAALRKHNNPLAAQIHQHIQNAVAAQSFQFNECFHGLSKDAQGVAYCAWSAGGLVIAQESLRGKELFF